MAEFVFFYGTLLEPFQRTGRARIAEHLRLVGHGAITAALFDLGLYPAAVPSSEGTVRGEVHEVLQSTPVLRELDTIEGYRADHVESSLYIRQRTPVTLDDGRSIEAWVYFYNAPLGKAERIPSGDYLEHLKRR